EGVNGVGVAVLLNPSTGTQTLEWAWSDGEARPEGGALVLVYIQDANTADPVRDAAVNGATYADEDVWVTIDTEPDDLVLGFASSVNFEGSDPYIPDISLSPFIDNALINHYMFDVGEDVSPSSPSTTVDMAGVHYSTIAAISLKAAGPSELGLAGTAASVSSISGNLDAQPGLAGTVSSASSSSAALQLLLGMQATSASQSEITAALQLLQGLTGTIPSQSVIDAALRLAMPLSGSVDAVSTLVGGITSGEFLLSGTLGSVSTLAAHLRLAQALSGSIVSQSSADGNVRLAMNLTGDVVGASTLVSALALRMALSGAVNGISLVDGRLTIDGAMTLVGTIASSSELSGALSMIRRLTGQIQA